MAPATPEIAPESPPSQVGRARLLFHGIILRERTVFWRNWFGQKSEPPFHHMEHELLEAATVERCLLRTESCVLRTRLTAPGQLPTDSGIRAPSSIFIPWHRFGTLLWQAFEHGGARPNLVCL